MDYPLTHPSTAEHCLKHRRLFANDVVMDEETPSSINYQHSIGEMRTFVEDQLIFGEVRTVEIVGGPVERSLLRVVIARHFHNFRGKKDLKMCSWGKNDENNV